ncbi:MAG TPA: LamG-like jellyroll fold domain-containing protein [Streptosporangiaceae bacterium]|nr:LamG-like jellyroll fold domain-containing protein [Streptosporangiaceae bacterium]
MKVLAGCTVVAMASAVTAVPALQAAAAPVKPATAIRLSAYASGSGPGQSVSATVSPSWQTNGTVWSITSANGVVYVGGGFTSVRPPGDPLGTGEVARTGLAAFNASTGALITTFDPVLSGIPSCSANSPCGVTALAVSPDGSTLYVGGSFTGVNGSYRGYLAAFSTSTGALLSTWKPAATGPVHTIAPSPDGLSVYVGGDFTKLDGQARTKAGAVSAATGALLPWAPALNGSVTSIAVAPDGSRVLVGGYFTTFNGVTQQSIGSTNPSTGASATWVLPSNFIPDNPPGCVSDVKDIIVSGGTAYIADEGTGAGCFDGDFAVHISDGSLVWQSDCLGATQSLVIINGLLYKGSHAHDCAYAPGGFPQVANPSGKGWVVHRLLTQSLADGSVGHWTPNTNGNQLGPRVMATDGTQLFLGGDFTTVNQQPQQGFARFAPTPDTTTPGRPGQPTVASTSAGVDSVTFNAVSDSDDGTLSYAIYRDSGKTPIATLSATSWPWALPVLHYRDAGLVPGSSHTYTVTASDGVHTSSKSVASAPVTVSSKSPPLSYWQTVLGDHPSFLWKLSETSGTTAADSSSNGFTGIYESGTTQGVAGPITGDPTTATSFNGVNGLVAAAKAVSAPQNFSIEGWFKTTTNTGGKLIGFGSSQTGMSTTYDRSIYLMNDGQLVFGVYSAGVQTIESPRIYNDGRWHYVVATIGSGGMALYVDGHLIGTNPATTAQNYSGYWRVGGDNLKGAWNLDYWKTNSQGTTEPYGYYVNGTIADVAVYPTVLTAAQVAAHYAANALSH